MSHLYFCEPEEISYPSLGSLEELQSRADHFEDRINVQKEKKRQEQGKRDDIEEEMGNLRNHQRELLAKQGRLLGEAEVIMFHLLCLQQGPYIKHTRNKNGAYLSENKQFAKLVMFTASKGTITRHWNEKKS